MADRGEDEDLGNFVLEKYARAEGITSVLKEIVRGAWIAWVAYYGYKSIDVLAGRETDASIELVVSFFTNLTVADILPWVLTALAIGMAYLFRTLKRDTVENLHPRLKQYEQIFDPNRTSSELTPRGETAPEDEL